MTKQQQPKAAVAFIEKHEAAHRIFIQRRTHQMIEQYESDIEDIKQNLDRSNLSKRERLQWILSIGKLSDRILADFEKQTGHTLLCANVKNQVEWLARWEHAELKVLTDNLTFPANGA